ncbi:unnamed protein product [Phaeothamnion confervicola]
MLAAVAAITTAAHAQSDYPNRVVKIVNPYPAGGTTDILTRALAVGLSSRLGQQFVVENKPGAGGGVGTAGTARSTPDGYELLFAPALVLSVLPQVRGANTGYKPDALAPICQTFENAMGLVVNPDSPIKNVADLVTAARARPGALNYGHQGPSTIPHLAMEEFLLNARIDIKDIPFRGDGAVITDVLGGRIDVGAVVMGIVAGQNVRIIGIFAETRHSSFPDVPTVKEQGFDVSPTSFGGLLAPAATPAPVLSKLASACEGAAKDEVYAIAAKRAAQPANYYADAATFRQRLQRDTERKAAVLERIKATP